MSQSTIRILRRGQHLSYLATLVPWGGQGLHPWSLCAGTFYNGWQDPESSWEALQVAGLWVLSESKGFTVGQSSAQGQILGPMWISAMGLLK